MSFLSFIKPLFGPIISMAGDHFEGQRKIKLAKVEAKIALIQGQSDHENAWENQAIRNAQTSWKDEYFTIILTLPIVACFFPYTAPHAAEGFRILLEVAPEWLIMLVGVMVLTSFGLRPKTDGNILTSMQNWKRKTKTSQVKPEVEQ